MNDGVADGRSPVSRTEWVILATLFVGFAIVCAHQIAGPWLWGHNGYMGAAFTQAVRNTFRFGTIAQAWQYTGLEPPPPAHLYVRHPWFIHAHLVGVSSMLGVSPFATRLVPFVYSLANFGLIVYVARKYFGRACGIAAGFVFATSPIVLIFANTATHEQGGAFYCLLSITMFLRWREARTWSAAWCVFAALAAAMAYDWPGYYFAFFVFAALVAESCVSRAGRYPALRMAGGVVVVVVLLAGVHYMYAIHSLGNVDDLVTSFRHRTTAPSGYVARILQRFPTVHTRVYLGLMIVWLWLLPHRLLSGKIGWRDMFPGSFLITQIIHSSVFKNAGFIHVYWSYYLAIAVAFCAASAWMGIHRWFERRSRWVALALSALLAITQVRDAARIFRWGVDTGHAAYVIPYDDQYALMRFVEEVRRRHGREQTHYVVDPRLQMRIEAFYYLDAPYTVARRPPIQPRQGKVTVFLTQRGPSEKPGEWIEKYGDGQALVIDDEFLALNISATQNDTTRLKTKTTPAPPLWKWFISRHHPPQHLVPQPDRH